MRYLNLEVLLLLVTSVLVAEHTLKVHVIDTWFLVVPAATWAIYTIDRIRDVRTAIPATGRHHWHRRYDSQLRMAVVCALAGAIIIAIVSFPPSYWYAGIALAAMTLLHIPFQRSTRPTLAVVKDVNVSLVFTIAAWALPLVEWWQSAAREPASSWLPMLIVMLCTILMNVIHLSKIDQHADEMLGLPSIAVVLGERGVRHAHNFLLAIVLLVAVLFLTVNRDPVRASIATLPAVLYRVLRFSGPADHQRMYVEVIPTLWIFMLWT